MNKTLLKATLKANWSIGLFITLILMMYLTISITMFDPESAEAIEGMMNVLPKGMAKTFGFDQLGTELTSYLGNYLYGFIFIMFPMIYTVIVAYKLIAKLIDHGSMVYLLTTPHTRVKIAITQALYLIISIAIILGFNVFVGVILSEMMFNGMLNIGRFLALNWITFLVITTMGGIGFFFSCYFEEVKTTLAFSVAVPVLFLVFKMVSGISERTEWIRFLSLYSFIDVSRILSSTSYVIVSSVILLILASLFYIAAIIVFNRRSLSI